MPPIGQGIAVGDLGLRQVFPSANVAVGRTLGRNCSIYESRRNQLQVRIDHVFRPLSLSDFALFIPRRLAICIAQALSAQCAAVGSQRLG